MLQLKELREGERSLDSRWSPGTRILAACSFLKRYDFKRVRRWGSANDMIPWELCRRDKDIEGVRRIA